MGYSPGQTAHGFHFLGMPQLFFHVFPFRKIDMGPHHPFCFAIGIFFYRFSTAQYPSVSILFGFHPEFHLKWFIGMNVPDNCFFGLNPVVRVQQGCPCVKTLGQFIGRISEHGIIPGAEIELSCINLPVPETITDRIQYQFQLCFIFLNGLKGFFGPGDIADDKKGTKGLALFRQQWRNRYLCMENTAMSGFHLEFLNR